MKVQLSISNVFFLEKNWQIWIVYTHLQSDLLFRDFQSNYVTQRQFALTDVCQYMPMFANICRTPVIAIKRIQFVYRQIYNSNYFDYLYNEIIYTILVWKRTNHSIVFRTSVIINIPFCSALHNSSISLSRETYANDRKASPIDVDATEQLRGAAIHGDNCESKFTRSTGLAGSSCNMGALQVNRFTRRAEGVEAHASWNPIVSVANCAKLLHEGCEEKRAW